MGTTSNAVRLESEVVLFHVGPCVSFFALNSGFDVNALISDSS